MLVFENPNSQDPANLAQNIQNLINEVNKMNSTSSQLRQTQNAEVANDGTTDRVVFGFQQGLQEWGLFSSQPGKDALTTTNLSDFIFNSNQNVFKIIEVLTGEIPAFSINGTSAYSAVSIPHNQNFTPIVNVFVSGMLVYYSGGAQVVADSYIPLPIFTTNAINTYSFPSGSGTYYTGFNVLYAVTASDVIVSLSISTTSTTDTFSAIPVTIFVLQQSV